MTVTTAAGVAIPSEAETDVGIRVLVAVMVAVMLAMFEQADGGGIEAVGATVAFGPAIACIARDQGRDAGRVEKSAHLDGKVRHGAMNSKGRMKPARRFSFCDRVRQRKLTRRARSIRRQEPSMRNRRRVVPRVTGMVEAGRRGSW